MTARPTRRYIILSAIVAALLTVVVMMLSDQCAVAERRTWERVR